MLGFVEGEGSFFLSKTSNYKLKFFISQSSRDLALMEELKNFFNNLRSGISHLVRRGINN